MDSCRRPNRSDVHLPREEEAKIEEKTKAYFDGIAPKRHTKPQRSEYSPSYVDAVSANGANGSIPEFVKFQRLEDDPQKLVYNGNDVEEEFVETEYYKDLSCIDKQHHMTGTGFINMENKNEEDFGLSPDCSAMRQESCKGNPATNDWIPAASDLVTYQSDKPKRSEN